MKTEQFDIRHQDNMELMAEFPDNHFDLAIVDPPYRIDADKKQNSAAEQRKNAKKGSKAGRGWKEYKHTEWDSDIPKDEYFIELFRVSKKQIIWGGNYFPLIWNYSNSFIIWNKMQRDFSLADGELAWYSENEKAMRTFDFSRGGALSNNNNNGGRFHPTQKPVKLYEWLFKNYAEPNQKILDTHLGSGSIAIALNNMNNIEKMNLHLTACELDEDYFKAACKRIEQQTRQRTIFD